MLSNYLSEEDYRLQMHFEKGTFKHFYAPTADHEGIIAERKDLLAQNESRYLAVRPEAAPLLDEFQEMLEAEAVVTKRNGDHSPAATTLRLGQSIEPDFLLLLPNEIIQLVAGVVCFPSSWALEEKIGHGIASIHSVVPSLNESLGKPIHGFLSRMKPGISWDRTNWGLSRSPERNQHPARKLPRLDNQVRLDEVFFRVEEQSLVLLPRTGGILFGIRLRIAPLAEIKNDDLARARMIKALQTIPEKMAEYKGFASCRERLLELLR